MNFIEQPQCEVPEPINALPLADNAARCAGARHG